MFLKSSAIGIIFIALSLSVSAENRQLSCTNDGESETFTVTLSDSKTRVTQQFREGHYLYPDGRLIEHEVLFHHYSFPVERRRYRPIEDSWNASKLRFERYSISNLEQPRIADDPRSVLLLRSLRPAPRVEEQRQLFAYRADALEFAPQVVHINWATNRLWVIPDGESVRARWHCKRLDP